MADLTFLMLELLLLEMLKENPDQEKIDFLKDWLYKEKIIDL
jgi:hypothetical protein